MTQGEDLTRGQPVLMDKGLTRTRGDEVFLPWLDLKRRLNLKQRLDPSLKQGEGLTQGQRRLMDTRTRGDEVILLGLT